MYQLKRFDAAYEASKENKQCGLCKIYMPRFDETIKMHLWDRLACHLCNCGHFTSTFEAMNSHTTSKVKQSKVLRRLRTNIQKIKDLSQMISKLHEENNELLKGNRQSE